MPTSLVQRTRRGSKRWHFTSVECRGRSICIYKWHWRGEKDKIQWKEGQEDARECNGLLRPFINSSLHSSTEGTLSSLLSSDTVDVQCTLRMRKGNTGGRVRQTSSKESAVLRVERESLTERQVSEHIHGWVGDETAVSTHESEIERRCWKRHSVLHAILGKWKEVRMYESQYARSSRMWTWCSQRELSESDESQA